jgi:hypothetical protein
VLRRPGVALAFALVAAPLPGAACSPRSAVGQSGFTRPLATPLPSNARGVRFYLEGKQPRPGDFVIVSRQDTRVQRVRLTSAKGTDLVRVEPVYGFKAGARYEIAYRRKHAQWTNPDRVRVDIDSTAVDTGGAYAFKLAPGPVQRVVTVPSLAGSCIEAVPVIAQEFGYALPPQLDRYAAMLEYEAWPPTADSGHASELPKSWDWRQGPSLHAGLNDQFEADPQYTPQHNAVIVPCDARFERVSLEGAIRFPEVEFASHRLARVELAMHPPGSSCTALEALTKTMQVRGAERVLRQVCAVYLDPNLSMDTNAPMPTRPDKWIWTLGFLHEEMAATCQIVTLAHVMASRRLKTTPEQIDALVATLRKSMSTATPQLSAQLRAAVAYLIATAPPHIGARFRSLVP